MASRKDVRDWLFRGMMFESDAEKFRSAGLHVGADARDVEQSLLQETLAPFGVQLRNESLRMARLYALMFCFENSVRTLISERLLENFGAGWWNDKIAPKIKTHAESRKADAEKNSWLEGQKSDLLSYLEFGHLSQIIINNWETFSDLIPTQHWLKQRMDELEKTRNYIAHNRILLPAEFQRIEMYIADWNRMVGL